MHWKSKCLMTPFALGHVGQSLKHPLERYTLNPNEYVKKVWENQSILVKRAVVLQRACGELTLAERDSGGLVASPRDLRTLPRVQTSSTLVGPSPEGRTPLFATAPGGVNVKPIPQMSLGKLEKGMDLPKVG